MFSTQFRIAVAVLLASAAIPALAGGFYVLLGNPEASSKAKAAGAVVTIKLAGCHEPEKANVTLNVYVSYEIRRCPRLRRHTL